MSAEYYTLAELSERAEVPERTVRYYIQEKLIPPSIGRGRKARYSDEHLERLREIRELRALGISLEIIHMRMAEYESVPSKGNVPTVARCELALESSSAEDAGPPEPPAPDVLRAAALPPSAPDASASRAEAAADYIAEARASAVTAARIPPAVGARHFALPGRSSAQSSPGVEERSRWERIAVTPEIEIHVRRPQPRSQKRALEQLIETAKELFAEESS